MRDGGRAKDFSVGYSFAVLLGSNNDLRRWYVFINVFCAKL